MESINNKSGKKVFIEIVLIPIILFVCFLLFSILESNLVDLFLSLGIGSYCIPYFFWIFQINSFYEKLYQKKRNTLLYIFSIVIILSTISSPFVFKIFNYKNIVFISYGFMEIPCFYVIFSTAKNILSNRKADFFDYIYYFFCLGLYPIGLFQIQKEMKKIKVKKA